MCTADERPANLSSVQATKPSSRNIPNHINRISPPSLEGVFTLCLSCASPARILRRTGLDRPMSAFHFESLGVGGIVQHVCYGICCRCLPSRSPVSQCRIVFLGIAIIRLIGVDYHSRTYVSTSTPSTCLERQRTSPETSTSSIPKHRSFHHVRRSHAAGDGFRMRRLRDSLIPV